MAAIVTRWPFGALKPRAYNLLLVDVPWRFKKWSRRGAVRKMARHHYATMNLEAIAKLPVAGLAAPDCVLVLWTTAPHLDRAIELLRAWEFTFKTAGAWAKRSPRDTGWAFGTGYVYRSAAEFWLLGTHGKPQSSVRDVRNLIVAPRREHSRKPDQMYDDLERMYPHARKCELFSRTARRGWDSWGAEVGKFNCLGVNHGMV